MKRSFKLGEVITYKGHKVTVEFINKRMLNVVWFDEAHNLHRDKVNVGRLDQVLTIIKETF